MKRGGKLYNYFNEKSGGALVRRDVLKPLRVAAQKSPTALAALAWFDWQNIDIVFDEALIKRKVMGRYNRISDKQWIALSPKFMGLGTEDRLDTLVHEIRHAWQDANGLMLPYSFLFNVQYGMHQAFLMLCLEEADAHAHGMSAGYEFLGGEASPLAMQVSYIKWFNEQMPEYLRRFVDEWTDLLAKLKAMVDGDARKMQAFLDAVTDAGEHPIDVPRLVEFGAAFGGENYMADAEFHDYVLEKIMPAAKTAYRLVQGDKIVELTSTMDELRTLVPAALRTPKLGRAA